MHVRCQEYTHHSNNDSIIKIQKDTFFIILEQNELESIRMVIRKI